MADIPGQNSTAQDANKIIAAANSAAIQLVEALIVTQLPFLGLPVIKQILGLILGWLDGFLVQAEQTGITFAIISTQINNEEDGLTKAKAALISAQAGGDKNAIAKAIQDYANAVSKLTHLDGSAPIG